MMHGILPYILNASSIRALRTIMVSPAFIAHIRRYRGNCQFAFDSCSLCPLYCSDGPCLPLLMDRNKANSARLRLVNIVHTMQRSL